MKGITGYGVFVPFLRLERAAVAAAHAWHAPALKALARGTRAIANWDEDAITMAVEASRDCGGETPARLYFASTSLPFADRQNAGVVKEALALSDDIATIDIAGSRRAGTSALLCALADAGAGLCVAAEKQKPQAGSEGDLTAGDAAAAISTGSRNIIAEVVATHSFATDFVDQFRGSNSTFSYGWESRWVRDEGYGKIVPAAIAPALVKAGLAGGDIDHFAFASPARGVADRVARSAGIKQSAIDETLFAQIGDCAAAQPLVLLAQALEKAAPGETILVAGFGQGCDVLIFRATPEIAVYRSARPLADALARRETTSEYLRYLALGGQLDVDRGMRAEQDMKTPLTALYRERKAVLGLIGGRCTRTGAIQFPKSDLSVDVSDPAFRTQEDYRFADVPARVVTYTADRLAYTPSPPYFYGTIAFDGGGRMVAEFSDCSEAEIQVGAPVRMMFRIKNRDELRGFTRYFWKAVPDRSDQPAAVAAE
ncbi:MAG: OB-fold domain-containing protein [Beijerinckiaceae bacterium]|nr:OB-fold domain-containing protein [Beijerinckiaceae bacterium]